MIPKLVDANQSTFMADRSILDNFMLMQQSIRTLHRQKTPALLFKIDIAKAFDSVSWHSCFRSFNTMALGHAT